MVKDYKQLDVWQKSIDLVDHIYQVTLAFPKEEIYGLSSQMRRSSVSIASNIAEGSARHGIKEFVQFIGIARGSLAELETQMIIAGRRSYVAKDKSDVIGAYILDINKMLTKLTQALERNL